MRVSPQSVWRWMVACMHLDSTPLTGPIGISVERNATQRKEQQQRDLCRHARDVRAGDSNMFFGSESTTASVYLTLVPQRHGPTGPILARVACEAGLVSVCVALLACALANWRGEASVAAWLSVWLLLPLCARVPRNHARCRLLACNAHARTRPAPSKRPAWALVAPGQSVSNERWSWSPSPCVSRRRRRPLSPFVGPKVQT